MAIHFFIVGMVIAKSGPSSRRVLTLQHKDSEGLLQEIDVTYWESTELMAHPDTVYFISGSAILHMDTGCKACESFIAKLKY
jgi:hypothetical protein